MKKIKIIVITLFIISIGAYSNPNSDWKMTVIDRNTNIDSLSMISGREYRIPKRFWPDRDERFGVDRPATDKNGRTWVLKSEPVLFNDDTTGGWFTSGENNPKYCLNSRYHIIMNNDTVFSFRAVTRAMPTNGIAKTFLQNDNYVIVYQKILRYEKEQARKKLVYSINANVNGEDLNESRVYENTVAPLFIDGKLFYLFQKDGKWGWSFDGIEHPGLWDRIFYNYGDGAYLNKIEHPNCNGFTVRKDGKWSDMRCVFVR